jgi:hypothetical protein
MTTKTTTTVDDTQYRFSHGAAPRGRGSWAFTFGVKDPVSDQIWWTPGGTTYAEAKKLAKAEAKARGFSGTIYAMP